MQQKIITQSQLSTLVVLQHLVNIPREAYELLKFMSFGQDGWKTRIELYNDETQKNSKGLVNLNMTLCRHLLQLTQQKSGMITLRCTCKGMDDEHVKLWKEYFVSCMQPIPYGWTSIAGYWNYCNEYFNKIDIHTKAGKRRKESC